jgi:hypothetical protein
MNVPLQTDERTIKMKRKERKNKKKRRKRMKKKKNVNDSVPDSNSGSWPDRLQVPLGYS